MIQLVLATLLYSQIQCAPGNPALCSAPIKKGEASLLDGQVLSPDLALELGQKAEHADAILKLELERAGKLHQIDLDLQIAKDRADQNTTTASVSLQKQRADYWEHRALKSEETPPFYASTHAYFVYGVLITALIVALVAGEMHAITSH